MDGSVGVKVFSFWISIGLPSAYCFAGMEVAIRKDPESGDVIRSLAGQPIPNREALSRVLALYASPGDTVDVGVLRDGRLQSVRLTLGARPSP